jgi:hypothetical protein
MGRRGSRLALPCRFEIRHYRLTARRVGSVLGALRDARRDRPKPSRLSRCRVRPHDPADVPITVEHVVVVVRPCAARAELGGVFEGGCGVPHRH